MNWVCCAGHQACDKYSGNPFDFNELKLYAFSGGQIPGDEWEFSSQTKTEREIAEHDIKTMS